MFAEVIKRGISLCGVHGRINICDNDSTTRNEASARGSIASRVAGGERQPLSTMTRVPRSRFAWFDKPVASGVFEEIVSRGESAAGW